MGGERGQAMVFRPEHRFGAPRGCPGPQGGGQGRLGGGRGVAVELY